MRSVASKGAIPVGQIPGPFGSVDEYPKARNRVMATTVELLSDSSSSKLEMWKCFRMITV